MYDVRVVWRLVLFGVNLLTFDAHSIHEVVPSSGLVEHDYRLSSSKT